ncbi:MAG TPA: hypothetical protein VKS44_15695 [Candidatus Acidoferrales bacterium]|nr:hypothetical protein [Candidatus Acidoferrales bacterium]
MKAKEQKKPGIGFSPRALAVAEALDAAYPKESGEILSVMVEASIGGRKRSLERIAEALAFVQFKKSRKVSS